MFQRLIICLAQVKTGNTFEKSLKEVLQIIYSSYEATGVTKKAYNNIMSMDVIQIW